MDRASEVRWRPNDQPTKEWKVMHIRGGEHNANNNNENREIRPQNIRQRVYTSHRRTEHEERREWVS